MASEPDWIMWEGGDSPIIMPRVEVMYRSGETSNLLADMMLEDGDWWHEESDPDGDIIAYRVVA